MIASSHGYSSIVRLLLAEYHANVNEQNMYVVLNYPLWYSRWMLPRPSRSDVRCCSDGWNALFDAASGGLPSVARLLLEFGIDHSHAAA
jgi:hypothetical protein